MWLKYDKNTAKYISKELINEIINKNTNYVIH